MIGDTIKDFKVTALLGKGGMGEVYAATQQLVRTQVAIKLLREETSQDRQHVQRFFNEAITASKIKHAGIVKIFDAGFHGSRAYLIMELLEGESLAARIRRLPRLAIAEVLDIATQMAGVLEATHAEQITHRDLKPDNVFLVPDAELARGRRVKILDFGIAKLGTVTPDGNGATVLTLSNSSMGTPAYMAPEQWNDAANADARADIYSLGCVLFELCTGRPPFVVTSMGDACNRHLHEVPPRMGSLAPDFPGELDELIARMLAKLPADRPSLPAILATFDAIRARRSAASLEVESAPTVAPVPGAPGSSTGPAIQGAATAPAGVASPHDTDTRPPRRPPGMLVWGAIAVIAIAAGAILFARRGTGSGDRAEHDAARVPAPAVVATAPGSAASPPIGATRSTVSPGPAGTCPDDMVAAPGGTFWMGSRSDDEDEAKPIHEVTLAAYCIDRTEVTVAAYTACVARGACESALAGVKVAVWSDEKIKLWAQFCNGERADRGTHPINCVDWHQAKAFCSAAGKRLPTEAEWEYAARGTDGRRYPWGDEPPTETRLNACGGECRVLGAQLGQTWQTLYEGSDGWDRTAPVGTYPAGASALGVLDMGGNVSEWVADTYGPYHPEPQTGPTGAARGTDRVVRNNDWESFIARETRATHRAPLPAAVRTPYVGFRCAR